MKGANGAPAGVPKPRPKDMPKDMLKGVLKGVLKDMPKDVPRLSSTTKDGWRRSLRKKVSPSPNCCPRRIKGRDDNKYTTPV